MNGVEVKFFNAPIMNCPTCKNPIMNPSTNCEWCGSVINHSNEKVGNEILFFTAKWCGPCKMMMPIINKFKVNHSNLKIIDVDMQKNEAKKHDVKNIPYLIKLKNGVIIDTLSGVTSEIEIERFMLS